MKITSSYPVFESITLAQNASIVSDYFTLTKYGANSKFWFDLDAVGAGQLRLTYLVGLNRDDTFYTPVDALTMTASFVSPKRDRRPFYPTGTEFIRYKLRENDVGGPVTINGLHIVVSED